MIASLPPQASIATTYLVCVECCRCFEFSKNNKKFYRRTKGTVLVYGRICKIEYFRSRNYLRKRLILEKLLLDAIMNSIGEKKFKATLVRCLSWAVTLTYVKTPDVGVKIATVISFLLSYYSGDTKVNCTFKGRASGIYLPL